MAQSPIKSPYEGQRVITLPSPDYEADDVLVVQETEQLRALGDDLRSEIVVVLRERAHSITELADKLGHPKSTVGHHVKVLEKAGLVRVVRTRKVRAVTESYYGRTARLFLFENSDEDDESRTSSSVLRGRISATDARRFSRRLDKLAEDFLAAETPDGDPYGLAVALFRRAPDA